jgi:hypothetical protein
MSLLYLGVLDSVGERIELEDFSPQLPAVERKVM